MSRYTARLAELTVPEAAKTVIDEEINKLKFLDRQTVVILPIDFNRE